jgi:hypothetical protein
MHSVVILGFCGGAPESACYIAKEVDGGGRRKEEK